MLSSKNGEAERAMGIIKCLLNKEKDPYLAILSYRSTPLHTPSKLLMNRKLRTTVPITREQRKPKVPDQQSLRAREEEIKRNQKKNFPVQDFFAKLGTTSPNDLPKKRMVPDHLKGAVPGTMLDFKNFKWAQHDSSSAKRDLGHTGHSGRQ